MFSQTNDHRAEGDEFIHERFDKNTLDAAYFAALRSLVPKYRASLLMVHSQTYVDKNISMV